MTPNPLDMNVRTFGSFVAEVVAPQERVVDTAARSAPMAYDFCCYARLDLDEGAARRLLAWRDVFYTAVGGCDVFALRMNDASVRLYSDPPDDLEDIDGDWWRMASELCEFDHDHLLKRTIPRPPGWTAVASTGTRTSATFPWRP